MIRTSLRFASFFLLLFFYQAIFAQNVGVNTTGAAPAATNMFEVLQPSTTANSVGIYSRHLGNRGSGTAYAFQAIANGAGVNNVAAYLSATGASGTNYSLIVPSGGGNVGIGTASPATLLDISGYTGFGVSNYSSFIKTGTKGIVFNNAQDIEWLGSTFGSGYGHRLYSIDPGGNTQLRIATRHGSGAWSDMVTFASTGNVGIGTTTPGAILDVNQDANATALNVTGGGGGSALAIFRRDVGADGQVYINASGADPQVVFDPEGGGTTWSLGIDDSDADKLKIGTGAVAASTFVTLQSDGNVGIGSSTPSYKLTVYGASGNYPAYVGSPDGYLAFGPANAGWCHFATDRANYYFNTGARFDSGNIGSYDENLSLQTSGTTRITVLNSNGNVGIGTTGPTQSLHTTGHIQFDGRRAYFGTTQYLEGDNSSLLNWYGAHSTVTQILLRDAEGTQYGRVYGSGDGANFGLLDGDGNWSYLAVKDSYTAFRINDVEKARVITTGFDVTGKITTDGVNETSDIRLKKNVNKLTNALEKVNQLQGVTYEWKNLDEILAEGIDSSKFIDNKNIELGFIAQDVEQIVPELINTDEDGFKSVQYSKIVALLNEAIKELSGQNAMLKEEMGVLRSELEQVKANQSTSNLGMK